MHEHRLEFGIAERTTSTSAQHKFELESVGLVLGARLVPLHPMCSSSIVASGDELEHLSQSCGGAMNWRTSHRPAAAR